MGKILTLGCKVKHRGVPKIWPISETGKANILNSCYKLYNSLKKNKVEITIRCPIF